MDIGDTPVAEEVLTTLGVNEDAVKQLEHSLYMFMKNFTAGHAKEVIKHGVYNGIDAWRELYKDQLPLAEDKRNILMTEFMKLKEPASSGRLRHLVPEIERITDNCERVEIREEAEVGNLRELVSAATWNYIAQGARSARTYRELVSIVMNQLRDPKTGVVLGERVPAITGSEHEAEAAYAVCKGGFGGTCWECGEKGHRARDCRYKDEGKGNDQNGPGPATDLAALNYKGRKGGKAVGKGYGSATSWQTKRWEIGARKRLPMEMLAVLQHWPHSSRV